MQILGIVLSALVATLLGCTQVVSAAEVTFEHVMTIGSEGGEEGRFRYVEDLAFSKDGRLLVTDAAHGWVQVSISKQAHSSRVSVARETMTPI